VVFVPSICAAVAVLTTWAILGREFSRLGLAKGASSRWISYVVILCMGIFGVWLWPELGETYLRKLWFALKTSRPTLRKMVRVPSDINLKVLGDGLWALGVGAKYQIGP
jgi:hypothetical protein